MIVIPMAGLSSRFLRAGYDRPKWMLPLAGRPLFDWSLLSFSRLFESEAFLMVFREGPGVEDFVKSRTECLGIADCRFVGLPEPTLGQADTVAQGLLRASVPPSEALTIFNIDTIRPGYSPPEQTGDGWIECFRGEGDHWSFVKPSPDTPGQAEEVKEKIRISSLCSTGMYIFKSAELFFKSFDEEASSPSANELFVAPMYQRLIEKGHDIRYGTISDDEIFFSGTPAEYEFTLKLERTVAERFSLSGAGR